jgi:hypothetical protein
MLDHTTRMEIVTHKDESDRLLADWPKRVPVFDVVLDDGSLIREVVAFGDRAVGVIVGGHTGFIAFAAVPELASRQVREFLRLTRIHGLPFIGQWLRCRWAARIGASSARPSWIPKL